jgi:DNA-binding response OmpR family regulator
MSSTQLEKYDESMDTDNQSGAAMVVAQRADRDAKLIKSALKKLGFSVISVEDDREAAKVLASPGFHLELAVVDPAIPGLDLRSLLKKLEESGSDAHVLCLRGEGFEKTCEIPEFADRISAYVSRPFRRSHLLASILDAERPLARTA